MSFKTILVAHDGTACSDLALQHAISLSKAFGSTLVVCHVTNYASAVVLSGPVPVDPRPMFDALSEESAQIAGHVREMAQRAGVEAKMCDVGDAPASGILQTAKLNGADLIVVGNHGKHGLGRFFDPSVSERIVSEIHVPLLVVPHDCPAPA